MGLYMKIFVIIISLFVLNISAYAEVYEKACPNCDFVIMEKSVNSAECKEYFKYFFKDKRIGKAYEEFGAYFVPNHKYAEYWKRYLPDSNEKYFVNKEYVNNSTVSMFYEILPKKIHIKEGKKANIEMIVDNEKYYFQLREVDGGTEITSCYSIIK